MSSNLMAVVPARYVPQRVVETRSQARARREERAALWVAKGARCGARAALAALRIPSLRPVTAALGAVVGGVWGAVASAWSTRFLPEAQAAPLRALVEAAVDERLQIAVAVEILQRAAGLPHCLLTLLPAAGPDATGARPDYRLPALQLFDTALEITVSRAGLVATSEAAPRAALEVELLTRIVPLARDAEASTRCFTHRSDYRLFQAWQGQNGRMLAEALDKAVTQLAWRAADRLLTQEETS